MTASAPARVCLEPDPDKPEGMCGARAVDEHQRCLAHMGREARTTYLATLAPGADINVRGVTFTGWLLGALLAALEDDRGRPHIGAAIFDGAVFTEEADFQHVTFAKSARFNNVKFHEGAIFVRAIFEHGVFFNNATFAQTAWFAETVFVEDAYFRNAKFGQKATFLQADFARTAFFDHASFDEPVEFAQTIAGFAMLFNEAVVKRGLHVEALTRRIEAKHLRGAGRVRLRLRIAEVDLTDTVLAGPLVIHGLQYPIWRTDEREFLDPESGSQPQVRVGSLRGVDASTVTLTNVDLRGCRFTGLHRADQLALEGQCLFANDPKGRRRVLAEEHYWRARYRAGRGKNLDGWTLPSRDVDQVGPPQLEVIYRQLRKALEDAKNEPGAADFYYGEMEMRREVAKQGRRVDRCLLNAYWATSGYALRVRRALTCLALVIAATIIALTVWGFPAQGKDLKADGNFAFPGSTQSIKVTVHESEPLTKLGDRIGKATEITLNAVIFRAADSELTTAGRYIDIAARLLGPLFLGLSVLAIRNHVKR